jgi:hypothetical protein
MAVKLAAGEDEDTGRFGSGSGTSGIDAEVVAG